MNFFSTKFLSSKKDAGVGGTAGSRSGLLPAGGSNNGSSNGSSSSLVVVGGMTNIVMRVSKSWDIKMPPPTKTVLGLGLDGGMFDNRMIDTGIGHFNLIQRKRKIVIGIHGPDGEAEGVGGVVGDASSSGSLSMHNAEENSSSGRSMLSKGIDLSSELKDDDLIVIRILKPRRGRWGIHKDYTEESESESESDHENEDGDEDEDSEEVGDDEDGDDFCNDTCSFLTSSKSKRKMETTKKSIKKKKWLQEVLKEQRASNNTSTHHHGGSNTKYTISREDTEWIEYRKFGLDEINQDDIQYRKTWEATIGMEKYRERRKLIFNSVEEAIEFKLEIDTLRTLSKHRATQRLHAYTKLQLQIKSQTKNRLSLINSKAKSATPTATTDIDHNDNHHPNQMIQSISRPLNDLVHVLNPVNIVSSALHLLPFEAVSMNPHGTTGVALQQEQQEQQQQQQCCNNNQPSVDNNSRTTTTMDDNIELHDDISLLVEIVSCSDLPVADITDSTDPYVVVFLGVNAIHKTEYIPKE